MNSLFDITYEIVDPATNESTFTQDRFIAETHYEKGYDVYEKHRTITKVSQFAQTLQDENDD